MKVESLNGNNVKARFKDTDTKKFGIAEEAHGLIMKYLTDLYDDPILAAIRETISNAIDAHKAAGTTNKVGITVSSPSDMTPYFEVTDTGVGMSREILTDVYTQYGISTKRDDDEAIGGFGLGCKSPLAIEDRFYVVTTQNGNTIVAEIYKNNSGEFVLDINDEYESGDPNGTTVRINLEKTSRYAFRDKLAYFLRYVNPDLYTLKTTSPQDDFSPKYALADKEKYHLITETDEFKVYANLSPSYDDTQKIVMGEVAYNFNIPSSILNKTKLDRESLKVVIVAPINSVTITTSRENTQDTKKTKAFLEKVYLQFEDDVNEYFQNYVDQAETPLDVYKRVNEARKFCRRVYKYKGEPVVDKLNLENPADYAVKRFGSSPARGRVSGFTIGGRERIFLVKHDETPETKEGAVTRAFNAFLSANELESGSFYFLDQKEPQIDSWWVKENPYIKFTTRADILKQAAEYRKAQRKNAGTRRPTGKVKYLVINHESNTEMDDDYLSAIEYPDIEKGIPYLTMEDLVAYGVTRSQNNSVQEIRFGIKRLLDFFDFSGEVLILDKGKKEDTMLKRVKAERLEFDVLSLAKHTQAAQKRAILNNRSRNDNWGHILQRQLGPAYKELKDPRFQSLLAEEEVEGAMEKDQYQVMASMIGSMFSYAQNDYFHKHSRALTDLKNKWREMGSYYWIARQTNSTVAKAEMLKGTYEKYVAMNVRSTNSRLVVQIFNTIYDEYLTPAEKMV